MQELFMSRDGQQFGPYSEAEVQHLIAQRDLVATDLVWYDGMPGWEYAMDAIPDLFIHAPSVPPPLPIGVGSNGRLALADDVDDDLDLYDQDALQQRPASRGLGWLIFRAPGQMLLWINYYFPGKGELWRSARQRGNPIVEVIYSLGFWFFSSLITLYLLVVITRS